MKLGILGTGMIVKDMLTFIHELGLEKAVILGTKRSVEKTKILAEQYHLDGYYFDYDELLSTDVDTIYVALPNSLHYSFALKALECGKHVIIEKPITSNARELRHLMEVASTSNLMIFEAMTVHYMPAFLSMKEDLKKLGDIRIVNANFSKYSSRYDDFKDGTILPAFDYHKSGGALMDINIYNIHTIIGLLGAPKSARYYPNIEQNIDVSGIMMYDYDDFKGVSIGAKDSNAPPLLEIQGDRGLIKSDNACNGLFQYTLTEYGNGDNNNSDNENRNGSGEPVEKNFKEDRHRMYYEFVEFIRMIDEKDFEKQSKMLAMSLEIAELMEKARLEQGIVFDADATV